MGSAHNRGIAMKAKTLNNLINFREWMSDSQRSLTRMTARLRSCCAELPSEHSDVSTELIACQESIKSLKEKVNTLFKFKEILNVESPNELLTDAEVSQLLALNRYLKDVMLQIKSVSADIKTQMEAKLADANDSMYDYEIEARLDYVLREDDSDYDEYDDNYLATRTEYLKGSSIRDDEVPAEIFYHHKLMAESFSWLLYDLYTNFDGGESSKLTLRDCLRIGKVFVDIQVTQQYDFNVQD